MTWDLRAGDCLDPVTGMASLADRSVDHVCTDPPFEEEAHSLQRRSLRARFSPSERAMSQEPLSFAPLTEEVRRAAAREFARLARRWILVFCQIEAVGLWRAALVDAGAVYKRACIWRKPDGQPQLTGDRPGMGYEVFVAAHAPGASRWNAGGRHGVWTTPKYVLADERTGHQTQKPVALMEALVRDFTDPGETILDPFAGSGTTGVAALRLGRRFIGWELDERYRAAAAARIGQVREQLALIL